MEIIIILNKLELEQVIFHIKPNLKLLEQFLNHKVKIYNKQLNQK